MDAPFRVGDWLVEPLHNRLVRDETRVKLDPKVMQVLVYLAEHAQEVALKEKILESVWEETFVADEVLTNAVWELRKALGDDAKEPRFIQTVPRKGYRLVATVHMDGHEPTPRKRRHPSTTWVATLALGLAAAAWWYFLRGETAAPSPRTVPLTGLAGAEWWPALSPDGERVAFVWDGGKPGQMNLYVQMVGSGDPLRLTETSFHEYSPAWSPDGREIAFLRQAHNASEVLVIPSMGGVERRLSTLRIGDHPGAGFNPGLAWSPDGRFLAVVDAESFEGPPGIFLLSLNSGEKHPLTSPPAKVWGDLQPAFAPDGKALAFARTLSSAESQIFLQPLRGGEPELLATPEGWITDLDWTPDGSSIVYVSAMESQAGTSVWRVPVGGGAPERLPFGEMAQTISISRRAKRMVYDRRSWFDRDIWRIDGPTAEEGGAPTRVIDSSRFDWAPEYSPDGAKIAFVSERAGNNNIWLCDSDGTDCFQLTFLERADGARWSPDGQRLVVDVWEDNHPYLAITEIEGGYTRRLTREEDRGNVGCWSHDGQWIYFSSDRMGEWQIWKIPAAGGEAMQVTREGGYNPRESADGGFLYYLHGLGPSTIRRVSVTGGEEIPIMEERESIAFSWALWRNSVVFATGDRLYGPSHIEVFDLDTQKMTQLFSLEAGGMATGMTVSPDGRSVLLSLHEPPVSDIMLVEGFP